MMPRMGFVAVLASVGLHLGGFGIGGGGEAVEMAGGGGAEFVALGNSFADMAAGRLVPVGATTQVAEPLPDVMPPVEPYAVAMVAAPVKYSLGTSPAVQAVNPVQATVPITVSNTANATPEVATMERRKAIPEPSELAVAEAPKPRTRPRQPEVTRRAPDMTATGTPRPAGAHGNAAQDARKGQANGAPGATAASTGANTNTTATGTGKADTYPGQVMRKIQNTRRERAGERGTAVVSFVIAPNGQVSSLGILRSSGSRRVDEVAVNHIRRAAPFPPPPPRAKVKYSIEVDSPG